MKNKTKVVADDFDDLVGGARPAVVSTLDQIRPLVDAGFAVHWLHPMKKRPIGEDWSNAPRYNFDELAGSYADGNNVGVRLGEPSKVGNLYLHAIDLDIRHEFAAAEAVATLQKLFPAIDATFPVVKSGSGGFSRHIYFLSDKPFSGKKLAHSDGFDMVLDPEKGRKVKKRHWEIDLFGTGKQVVLPPSVHPDTGAEYEWARPFDFDALELGLGPVLPSSAVELAGAMASSGDTHVKTDDRPTLNLSLAEAREIMFDLPAGEWCEDRDGWFRSGMALHHEFNGSQAAFELWCEFSAQSEKFDLEDTRKVWRSFRDQKGKLLRMATLLQVAKQERLQSAFATSSGFDSTTSDDDLLPDDVEVEALRGLPDWMRLLDLTEKGGIKATLPNVELIVRHDDRLAGVLAFNEFAQKLVRLKAPGAKSMRRKPAKGIKQLSQPYWRVKNPRDGDDWAQVHEDAIRALIETPKTQGGYGVKSTRGDVESAATLVAKDSAFHPVREYLRSVTWDGHARMEMLFVRYLGTEDHPYYREIAKLTLVAGVTRIFEPGHKFDYAVILEGAQGVRKSTFIATLAKRRAWFGELASDFDNINKMVESMQSKWILEIAELSGFNRSDVRGIKSHMSRTEDRARLAWEKKAQDYPRQCIFIGSTNDREYLRDDTGGRRFWPCAVNPPNGKNIDIDALKGEVDQLWAEAFAAYKAMRVAHPHGDLPLYLRDPESAKLAESLQASRKVESVEEQLCGRIAAWLEQPIFGADGFDSDDAQPRDQVCVAMIWRECLNNTGTPDPLRSAQIGRALNLLSGWVKVDGARDCGRNYGKQRVWRRIDMK